MINEDQVWKIFSRNWVFRLYFKTRQRFLLTLLVAVLLAFAPWLLGAIIALFAGSFVTYASNLSLYLNIGGFALALVAFGWFAHRLPRVLSAIQGVFVIQESQYIAIIEKWARRIANKNFLMVLVALPIVALNLFETFAIWRSPQPPILLEPWINSSASTVFGVIYGLLHAVIVPFLLGSGIVGMVGAMFLIGDVLKTPIRLSFYRRLSVVTEMVAWLVMWALVGLASIAVFGRPMLLNRLDIQAVLVSGIAQSIIGGVIFLSISSLPFIQVHQAIAEAKQERLEQLEQIYDNIYVALIKEANASLQKPTPTEEIVTVENAPAGDDNLQVLYKRLDVVHSLIQQVQAIPDLPISFPGAFRIIFGALFYIGSSAYKIAQLFDVL